VNTSSAPFQQSVEYDACSHALCGVLGEHISDRPQGRGYLIFRYRDRRRLYEMSEHKRFEKLVADAKKNITEISPQDAAAKSQSAGAVIVDVREKDEWEEEHIPIATHLSRGTIELDIEEKVPDRNALIICHCGGGGRSALAAESLQKMGYKNVRSMAGGFKAWKAAGLPTTK
jgi:rhodanese-related sulfurtransferase